MKRRISMLLATVLAGSTLVLLAPAQPVAAWTVCAGHGNATVGGGGLKGPIGINVTSTPQLQILVGNTNTIYPFTFNLTTGGCVHPPSTAITGAVAAGGVKGYCGFASGTGALTTGELFAFIGIGGLLLITGHLNGAVIATPDPTDTGSCFHIGTPVMPTAGDLTNGQLNFLIDGAAVLMNCTGLEPLVPGTPQDTEFLTRILDFETLSPLDLVHVKLHIGVHFYYNHICVGNPALI